MSLTKQYLVFSLNLHRQLYLTLLLNIWCMGSPILALLCLLPHLHFQANYQNLKSLQFLDNHPALNYPNAAILISLLSLSKFVHFPSHPYFCSTLIPKSFLITLIGQVLVMLQLFENKTIKENIKLRSHIKNDASVNQNILFNLLSSDF